MSNEIISNVSQLSHITYTNLINRIIEIDNSTEKRMRFNPETREIDYILNLCLNTTKSFFTDEAVKKAKNNNEALETIISQSREVLETLNIDMSKNPRKVCTNFANPNEEEKSIKLLSEHFSKTVCEDILKSNIPIFVPHNNYTNPKGYRSYFKKNGLNFEMLCDYSDSTFKICEMGYHDSPAYNKVNVLKQDTAIIEASTKNMAIDIANALTNFYLDEFDFLPPEEKDAVLSQLRDQPVIVDKLVSYIITMRVGYLKRTLSHLYLDFYKKYFRNLNYHQLGETKEEYRIFERYVDRFNQFENLMKNILMSNDFDTYIFDYNGEESGFDLIHSLRDASVYNCLPFIGIISEALSDLTNDTREVGQELYGLSVKFNGLVVSDGVNSLNYHLYDLAKIYNGKKELKSHYLSRGQEIAKTMILRFFLLGLDDANYDPTEVFMQDVEKLPKHLGDETSIKECIKNLSEDLRTDKANIDGQLEKIKNLLKKGFNEKKPFSYDYTKQLSILKSMLPKDLRNPDEDDFNIMHVRGYHTRLAKYTTLFDDDESLMHESLYSFKYKFKFDSKMLQSKSNTPEQTCIVGYDTEMLKKGYATSFILYPSYPEKKEPKRYEEVLNIKEGISQTIKERAVSAILIPYWDNDAVFFNEKNITSLQGSTYCSEAFRLVYELVYNIIVNTLINTICNDFHIKGDGKDISRERALKKLNYIHLQTLYRPKYTRGEFNRLNSKRNAVYLEEYSSCQTFIKSLSKCLDNSLHSIYTCQSQGYNIASVGQEAEFKAGNSNKSLNINKTKIFRGIGGDYENLGKCAVIVATSVKTDEVPSY